MTDRLLGDLVDQVAAKAVGPKPSTARYVGLEHIDPHSRRLAGHAPASISNSTNGVFESGDILFGKLRPNLRKAVQVGFGGFSSTDFIIMRAKAEADPGFAAHVASSDVVFRHAERHSIGTGMPRTSWRAVAKAPCWVPPLKEQRRIAEVLDTIDESVQATERVIAKLESLQQGTAHSLVGPATRPDDAPPEWKRGRVLDFFHLQRGFDITKDAQRVGRVPVVSSSGISSYHNEARVRGPGVVTGRKGKLGTAYYLQDDFWPHDTALWVTDFKGNDPQFVALFLNALRLERFDAATSVPTLNRNVVHPLRAAFPPVEDQRQIVAAFETGNVLLDRERECLRKLQATRSGLAADLLSGSVRTVAA